MKEINEIIEFLKFQMTLQILQKSFGQDNDKEMKELSNQLDNANKVKAKLQGAIDLFKDIEEL
jgi:hypothetical protein